MLPLSAKALAGLHILVAEDTPLLQRLAVTLLTKMGADVVAVDNGLLAVQAVRRTMTPGGAESEEGAEESPSDGVIATPPSAGDRADPPLGGDELQAARDGAPARAFDCLLMDCQMPQMDGYDATKAIRQMEKDTATHLPIIALTAHAMVEDEQKCLSSGMDAYQIKPINLKLLVSAIKKLIGEKRADRLSK